MADCKPVLFIIQVKYQLKPNPEVEKVNWSLKLTGWVRGLVVCEGFETSGRADRLDGPSRG